MDLTPGPDEIGEQLRQLFGIDGTRGDAQDVKHPFVGGSWCWVCGLNKISRKHIMANIQSHPAYRAGREDAARDIQKDADFWFGVAVNTARRSGVSCPRCTHLLATHWPDDERGRPGCHGWHDITRSCLCSYSPQEVLLYIAATGDQPRTLHQGETQTPTAGGEPEIKVHKFSYPVPLADGICESCGSELKYNLAAGLVLHTQASTCATPFPATPTAERRSPPADTSWIEMEHG